MQIWDDEDRSAEMQNWGDIHFTSRDGLRLYARHYPVPGSTRRPVVCLAGLTRNCRDFHDLATALASADEKGATSTRSTVVDEGARRTTPTGRTTPCWSSSTTCSTS